MTNSKGHFELISSAAALVVAALVVAQASPAAAQTPPGPAAMYAYVGSFTTAQRKARGDGIHIYRTDPANRGVDSHPAHRRSGQPVLPGLES